MFEEVEDGRGQEASGSEVEVALIFGRLGEILGLVVHHRDREGRGNADQVSIFHAPFPSSRTLRKGWEMGITLS